MAEIQDSIITKTFNMKGTTKLNFELLVIIGCAVVILYLLMRKK